MTIIKFLGAEETLGYPLEIADGVRMYFRRIEPGSFRMGSRSGDHGEEPVHEVRIPHEFYMGTFPVTQEQFAVWPKGRTIESLNHFPGDRLPVHGVKWNDAKAFCKWLGEQIGFPDEIQVRLPSEAQWEYCCRAGSETEYCNGDSEAALSEVGWFGQSFESGPKEVGRKKPNEFQIYDMHGNVWEWCIDMWDDDPYRPRVDDNEAHPKPMDSSPLGVVRGGSWDVRARACRSACRNWRFLDRPSRYLGFRVCMQGGSANEGGIPGQAKGGSESKRSAKLPRSGPLRGGSKFGDLVQAEQPKKSQGCLDGKNPK